jgi:hypothetical protein
MQADFLRNGSTKKVMNLSKRDSTQLWQSLASGKLKQFVSSTSTNDDDKLQINMTSFVQLINSL